MKIIVISVVEMAATKRRRIGQVYGGRKIIQVCMIEPTPYTCIINMKHSTYSL